MHPCLAPSSSPSSSLQEPLLLSPTAEEEQQHCSSNTSVLDGQDDDDEEFSISTYYDEDQHDTVIYGPPKNIQSNKQSSIEDLGLCSCLHWYISKFLFPLLLIVQHGTTLVLLVPFMCSQFGLEDEAASKTHRIMPSPRFVLVSNLALTVVLIWLYAFEKVPKTKEFLLRILHPAILVEMNVALMLILNNKEEVAILTLLVSMLGVGIFVLFSIQSNNNKVVDDNDKKKASRQEYRVDWV